MTEASPKPSLPAADVAMEDVPVGALRHALSLLADTMLDRRMVALPVLRNAVLERHRGGLALTGGGPDGTLTVPVGRGGRCWPGDDGRIALPVERLRQVLEVGGPATAISLRRTRPEGATRDTLEVTLGRTRMRLDLPAVEDHFQPPQVPMPGHAALPAEALRAALSRVQHAISREQTRYYLNGVFLHPEGEDQMRAVATDGHRLAIAAIPCPAGLAMPSVIVHRRMVAALLRLLPVQPAPDAVVRMEWGDEGGHLAFAARSGTDGSAHWLLRGEAIDGTFPDYGRVVPPPGAPVLTIHRPEALTQACRRAKALNGGGWNQVFLRGTDALPPRVALVHGEDVAIRQDSAMHETLTACAAEWVDGPAFPDRVGFKAAYLIDALEAAGPGPVTVTWHASQANDTLTVATPARFDGEGGTAVLMPMVTPAGAKAP